MAKIKLLDQKTANKIAAGEVIINPASVIKELLENSIDAHSSTIIIEIKKGGKEFVSIRDNGIGIPPDDALLSFQRHATSKIRTISDLEKTNTLGFRGEALASIAAVSKVDMQTKERSSKTGVHIQIHGSNMVRNEETGCSTGTTIKVEDIFYNTPARYKYLKKDSTEAGYVSSIIERIALSHPEISFRFINNDRQVFHTPGNNDLYSCIYCLYGKEFANNLMEIQYENQPLKITGYLGKPQLSRSNKKYQIFFINNRYVKNKILSQALEEAYKGLIMIHKFPVAILNIELPSHMLDINVHPAKTEILFHNESLIYLLIKDAILEQLKKQSLIPEVRLEDKKNSTDNKIKDVQEKISLNAPFYNKEKMIKENAASDIYKEAKNYTTIHTDDRENNARSITMDNPLRNNDKNNLDSSLTKKEAVVDKNEYETLNELNSGKIIGQIFSTYIIVEISQGLLLIDQHAAHERIAFNRLKDQYEKNEVISQSLLIPTHINISYQENQLIMDFLPMLERLGFEIEDFGGNSIIIRSVPFILGQPKNENYLFEILDNLEELKNITTSQEKEERLISMACKSAIKAHDFLQEQEIDQLIKDLVTTKQPFTCPHGRPTIVKVTKYQLERLFKRIQ